MFPDFIPPKSKRGAKWPRISLNVGQFIRIPLQVAQNFSRNPDVGLKRAQMAPKILFICAFCLTQTLGRHGVFKKKRIVDILILVRGVSCRIVIVTESPLWMIIHSFIHSFIHSELVLGFILY